MAEKMIRCRQGHFYDPGKYQACPWCAPVMPVVSPRTEYPQPQGRVAATSSDLKDAVTGWLVCLEGPHRGFDFRLHSAKNVIGRSGGMDICLAADETVSPEHHAAVVFDPKKEIFWLLPGAAVTPVLVNGQAVQSPVTLNPDDVIELGSSKLVFVPFCGGKYSWT